MIKTLQKISLYSLFQAMVIALLLALPYYMFRGQLFIGGDDTRLYYVYPELFLKNISLNSWFHFSSVGQYNPNFFLVPFLILVYVVKIFIRSPIVVDYLFFSTPLILGFIFSQLLIKECIQFNKKETYIPIIGSIFYIFSPILLVGLVLNFLYPVWLIPLIPILVLAGIKYYKSKKIKYVLFGVICSVLFSQALFSIPWLLGLLIPLFTGAFVYLVLMRESIKFNNLKPLIIYGLAIIGAQSFWLVPFIYTFFAGSNGYGAIALSADTASTFANTVNATSRGTVFYPLINLFHRQIAFDFNWPLMTQYLLLWDKTYALNLIFVVVLLSGCAIYRNSLDFRTRSLYIAGLTSFVTALFLFTVNIGPFKNLFIAMGGIPGFAMFRNGFDKFAYGYITIYSFVMTISLLIVFRYLNRRGKKYYKATLVTVFLTASLISFAPIKQVVNRPLWTTKDIRTTAIIPPEYTDFMNTVKSSVSNTTNILSIPYGKSSYTIVPGVERNTVYAGRSPVQVFTGINDISGSLSLPKQAASSIEQYIVARDYQKILNLLDTYNIKYAVVTKNIPKAVINSYLFDPTIIAAQDQNFKNAVFGEKLSTSSEGNYELYAVKQTLGGTSAINIAKPITISNMPSIDSLGLNELNNLQGVFSSTRPIIVSEPIAGVENISLLNDTLGLNINANDSIYSANNNVASLKFDTNSGSLNVVQDHGLKSNGKISLPNYSKQIATLREGDVIQINQRYYSQDNNQQEISIKDSDQVRILSSPVELGSGFSNTQGDWSKSICNSNDSNNDNAKFNFTADQVELSAINGRQACIYKKLKLSKASPTEVSFDYESFGKEINFVVTDANGKTLKTQDLTLAQLPGQHHFTTFLDYGDDRQVSIYLYSAKSEMSTLTRYRNISIKQFNDISPSIPLDFPKSTEVKITDNSELKSVIQSTVIHKMEPLETRFSTWNKSDCNNLNSSKNSVEFKIKDNTAVLKANNGHNACLYTDIEVNGNEIYTLEFDYAGTSSKKKVYIDTGIGQVPLQKELLHKGHFKENLYLPSNCERIRIYLYSGSSMKGSSSATYSGFTMSSFSKAYSGNYLIKGANKGSSSASIKKINKISNHKYLVVTVVPPTSKNIYLQLNDSFSDGWKVAGASKTDAVHTESNFYSNIWKLNSEELCTKSNNCEYDAAGNKIIYLTLEFYPQKLFYLGLIITVITLILVCTYAFAARSLTKISNRGHVSERD